MAEYRGRTVTLNKPRRLRQGDVSYGRKKSEVFVQEGGKVRRVTFGDPNMRIKKDQPGRRSNFRARNKVTEKLLELALQHLGQRLRLHIGAVKPGDVPRGSLARVNRSTIYRGESQHE
jgi:hypothetical protein